MIRRRKGVVLTLSASPARVALAGIGGSAWPARRSKDSHAAWQELGPQGARVVCIRPHRILDAFPATPDLPMPEDEFRTFLEGMTFTGTLPTQAEVGATAAFLASDAAGAMTGTVANLTGGLSAD